MKWTDSREIGIVLAENHPDIAPLSVSFVKLRQLVLDIPGFTDDPDRCNERILEAIQMMWLDEVE